MNKVSKTPKQLERHFKGVANHRRIQILQLISKQEGISLDGITQVVESSVMATSEHTRKLVQAGLVEKKYKGRTVAHYLTPYGKRINNFLSSF